MNMIMCEHPTVDCKGLIAEPLDLVCVKADCKYPNRYACEICRNEHSHNDQFVRINTICKFLEKETPLIAQQSEEANERSSSIIRKLNKLLKIIDDLKQGISQRLQEASDQCKNNHYFQLHNLIEANETCNSKQQIQKLGEILAKITKCERSQLQFVIAPFEFQYQLTGFQQYLDSQLNEIRCNSIFNNQTPSIIPEKLQSVKQIQLENPIFQFSKNFACSTLLVEDKMISANQDFCKQVALINSNLSQLQSPVSVKVNFYGGPYGGQNENRIGLYLGKVENYNFKYDASFLVVGDQKKQYKGMVRSDNNFCLLQGNNDLKIEYNNLQKKLSIYNEQNSNSICLDVPPSNDCYFCFILAHGASVQII